MCGEEGERERERESPMANNSQAEGRAQRIGPTLSALPLDDYSEPRGNRDRPLSLSHSDSLFLSVGLFLFLYLSLCFSVLSAFCCGDLPHRERVDTYIRGYFCGVCVVCVCAYVRACVFVVCEYSVCIFIKEIEVY